MYPINYDNFNIHLQNNLKKSTVLGYSNHISNLYDWIISRKNQEIVSLFNVKVVNPVDKWNKPIKRNEDNVLPELPDAEVVHYYVQSMKAAMKQALIENNNREVVLYARRIVSTMVMLKAGLRVSEVANLNVDDILLKEMLIIVRHGKGDKDRIVDLSKDLGVLLKWYLEEAHPCALKKTKNRKETPLFLSEQNRRISSISLKSEMKRFQDIFNIPIDKYFSPHGLRRLFATNLYKELLKESHPDPITYVKIQLGHVFYSTTLKYCRIEKAIVSRSANKAIDAIKNKLLTKE